MGHLAMCVDIFGYHSWQRGAPDLDQLEAKGAAKHPTMHRMPPQTPPVTNYKEFYHPKCRCC